MFLLLLFSLICDMAYFHNFLCLSHSTNTYKLVITLFCILFYWCLLLFSHSKLETKHTSCNCMPMMMFLLRSLEIFKKMRNKTSIKMYNLKMWNVLEMEEGERERMTESPTLRNHIVLWPRNKSRHKMWKWSLVNTNRLNRHVRVYFACTHTRMRFHIHALDSCTLE